MPIANQLIQNNMQQRSENSCDRIRAMLLDSKTLHRGYFQRNAVENLFLKTCALALLPKRFSR
jgi:hypothetical protein